ncbi:beta-galactosidase [Nibricoccus aquaticus]|uniref:Beta-galactosidase n=2 Tax=Nibricoccus aquaticus TaxID=2576891 RepID=A0A290QL92_9BACT|nr:beta-galactosidase [Nibricoccus aquaticus]
MIAADVPAAREALDFNPGWRLHVGDPAGAQETRFDDAGWKPVTLPRAWNEDEAFKKDIKDLSTGIAWYRKTFVLPAGSGGRKVFLEFEGVRQAAEVWINGKLVGGHENGINAFGLDVTEQVRPAPEANVIAVRTDNAWDYRERLSGARYQWSDKNFNANYGGIPKNVRLHVTDRVYQTLPLYSHLGSTGVYVYATDFDVAARVATIHAESEIRNEATAARTFVYRVKVADRDGRTVAEFDGGRYTIAPRESVTARASARVKELNFWSWGYGYLYTVTTSLESEGQVFDSVVTRTGFRKTEFGQGVVKLNDRVIQLKGYAQRTSNEWPALGMSVPPWLSDYSNGLMVESGANLVRWMHIAPWKQDVESCDRVGLMQMLPAGDSERDAQGRQWVQRQEVMRDAIIYNRNNPSVLVYESGNNGISEAHMADMKAIRDRFDPHGGRAIGSRDMLDSHVTEYGGEMLYVNKSARQPMWQTEYSRDEGLRKYWDEFSPPYHKDGEGPPYRDAPAPTYNRNQDTHAIENVVRWYDFWRERPGTGTRVNSGGVNIIFSDTNTHYRGAENYRRSGEVDAMRIAKDGFFAHQVMWDGWVDVETPRAHILGHWNYAAGVTKPVTVVSSAESVELFLNGKSLGRGAQSTRFLFTFPSVAWQPGTLSAVGYDAKGAKICEASHVTAGEPRALKLTIQNGPDGLRADAADVALVQVEVVDAQGRRCPTALNLVDFELSGPAEWRGGIAQGPDNFILSRSLPVECGVNRVLVRSTLQAGKIVLTANAQGLASAKIELDSQAVETTDGWSRNPSAAALAGRLGRGPTPGTTSFKVTRKAVAVAKASALDGGDPALAFDDNEETAWSGKKAVTFELSRVALLSEITLKTAGFRARSYPIRITVDGVEVFRGVTARSLGYVTLPLKPVDGRVVRIEPLAGSEARDAFGGITELVDQKNATTGEQNVGAGALGIIEIEFYEPAEL